MWQLLLLVPMGLIFSKWSVPLPSIYINDLDCSQAIRYDLSLGKPHNRTLNYTIDCFPGNVKIYNTTHVICRNRTTVITVPGSSSDYWRKTPETTIAGSDGMTTAAKTTTTTTTVPGSEEIIRTLISQPPVTSHVPPPPKSTPEGPDGQCKPPRGPSSIKNLWDQVRREFTSRRKALGDGLYNVFFVVRNLIYLSGIGLKEMWSIFWHSVKNLGNLIAYTWSCYWNRASDGFNRFIEDILPRWAAKRAEQVEHWLTRGREWANWLLEIAFDRLSSAAAEVQTRIVALGKYCWGEFKEQCWKPVNAAVETGTSVIRKIKAAYKFLTMTLPLFLSNTFYRIYYRLEAVIPYIAKKWTEWAMLTYRIVILGPFTIAANVLSRTWLSYIKPIVNRISPATATTIEKIASLSNDIIQTGRKAFENGVELVSTTFAEIMNAFWSGIVSAVVVVEDFLSSLFAGIRNVIHTMGVWTVEAVTDLQAILNSAKRKATAAFGSVVAALYTAFYPLVDVGKNIAHATLHTGKGRLVLLCLLAIIFVSPAFDKTLFHALCTGVGGPMAGHVLCKNGAEPIWIVSLVLYELWVLYWWGGGKILMTAFTFWVTQALWLVTAAFNIVSTLYLAGIHLCVGKVWGYVDWKLEIQRRWNDFVQKATV